MKHFVKGLLDRKEVEIVSEEEKKHANGSLFVFEMREHPWYPDGVVCIWESLHRSLRPKSTWRAPQLIADLHSSCAGFSDGKAMVTSIALRRPWSVCRLNQQAANMSCFVAQDPSSGAHVEVDAASKNHNTLFRFLQGPPGQISVRDDIQRKLGGVVQQLNQSGVLAFLYLSTIVIADRHSADFDALLSQTGATYRALRQAGLDIDAASSNLEPRFAVDFGGGEWSTVRYGSLKAEPEEYAKLLCSAFYVWLEDRYTWLCEDPIRAESSVVDSEFLKLLDAVSRHAASLGLEKALLEVDREALLSSCKPHLAAYGAPVPGPQRWSLLELRCFLHACRLYPC